MIVIILVNIDLFPQQIGLQAGFAITNLRKPSGFYGDIPTYSYGFNCNFGLKIGKRLYATIEPGYILKGAEEKSDEHERYNSFFQIHLTNKHSTVLEQFRSCENDSC